VKTKVLFGIEVRGDTIVLRMKSKSKSSGITQSITPIHKVRIEGISLGFKIVASILLSFLLANVVGSVFGLPHSTRYIVTAVLAVIVSVTVSIKPRLLLTVVCVMLSLMGLIFIVVSLNEESISEIEWDPSLLGAGTSLVALAIAVYVFLMYTERKEDVINISRGSRGVGELEGGYVWIEEIKKYRCMFCLSVGRYYYCRTLRGIRGHIMSKHICGNDSSDNAV